MEAAVVKTDNADEEQVEFDAFAAEDGGGVYPEDDDGVDDTHADESQVENRPEDLDDNGEEVIPSLVMEHSRCNIEEIGITLCSSMDAFSPHR